jgi:hypothetical protein
MKKLTWHLLFLPHFPYQRWLIGTTVNDGATATVNDGGMAVAAVSMALLAQSLALAFQS